MRVPRPTANILVRQGNFLHTNLATAARATCEQLNEALGATTNRIPHICLVQTSYPISQEFLSAPFPLFYPPPPPPDSAARVRSPMRAMARASLGPISSPASSTAMCPSPLLFSILLSGFARDFVRFPSVENVCQDHPFFTPGFNEVFHPSRHRITPWARNSRRSWSTR